MSGIIGSRIRAAMQTGSPGGPRTFGSGADERLYGAKDNQYPPVLHPINEGRGTS